MHTVKISNFRCFSREQTVHLAPLTILVGENSTGKSSLLGIIRIIWSIATMTGNVPYNDTAFPFGGFNEMVSRSLPTKEDNPKFMASIDYSFSTNFEPDGEYSLKLSFQKNSYEPRISNVTIIDRTKCVSIHFDSIEDKKIEISFETPSLKLTKMGVMTNRTNMDIDILAKNLEFLLYNVLLRIDDEQETNPLNSDLSHSKGSRTNLNSEDRILLKNLIDTHLKKFRQPNRMSSLGPIRTKPERFYQRGALNEDPEGKHIPEMLANIHQSQDNWNELTQKLNFFGRNSDLFDDLRLRSTGSSESDPFSILFRLSHHGNGEDPRNWRNIIDLGFGVGQVLPIITKLHLTESDEIILMQQPEVHLHPRAQAEFGGVLCEIAGRGRMLFVETHSDYLLDRVRINIRKGLGNLRAEDVSILFFKRIGEVAKIHSLKLDDHGNIVDAPDEYMDFFIKEGNDLLGLS